MKKRPTKLARDILFSLIVLFLLLIFVYAFFFEVPYAGLYFNPTTGQVLNMITLDGSAASLQVGDILQQVGPISWESYYKNGMQGLFQGLSRGDMVDIRVARGGQILTIPWEFPGFTWSEFWGRFFNIWWLTLFFWFFGMITHLFIRPRDTRWRLMVAMNYLTAFWLIAGSLSGYHFWISSIILHALTWLLVPIYIHFHWLFPTPLKRSPTWIWGIFYGASSIVAGCEFFQLLPRTLYFVGFVLALLGSIILLVIHFIKQPAEHGNLKLLGFATLIAISPSIILGVTGITGIVPQIGPMALLALPIMSGAYFYIVYRQQPGGMELRANKLVSTYIFLILVGTILILLLSPAENMSLTAETFIFVAAMIAILTAILSILIYPSFQAYIDQRFLGIKLPYQNLQETYSARIITSTSHVALVKLLKEEILPSLLVRQFGFLQIENQSPKVLMAVGVDEKQLLDEYDFSLLMSVVENYQLGIPHDPIKPGRWIRLVLPLRMGTDLLGFWLLGRRDPDDTYTQAELSVIQSLANQTAIAISNLLQTEHLRAMYQANVNRYEKERLNLALELHDMILNQLAVLVMNLDAPGQPTKFQDVYDRLTQRLREIVSDLRPPMLNYGLKPAIDELADNLMERNQDTVNIEVNLATDMCRYPAEMELHLFRIVQEGCENALRHAQARNITISGQLLVQKIILQLIDDGTGFETGEKLQLNTLIANKHFGLAGMVERAAIIGAELMIDSKPEKGTRLQISWEPAI